MAAWIIVFLKRTPERFDSETIRNGIAKADWWTLGESVELKEDEVDAFIESLMWSDAPLEVRAGESRPVEIGITTNREQIDDEIEELDEIEDLPMPSRVRDHLSAINAIASLEFGPSQLGTMVETIAFEIAFWLAETYDGLILFEYEQWHDHDKNRSEPIR